jgi:hypothetical protein
MEQIENSFKQSYGDKKGKEKYRALRTRLRRRSLQEVVWQDGRLKTGAQLYLELKGALLHAKNDCESVGTKAVPLPETTSNDSKMEKTHNHAA